ncbi:MAG: response regulator [Planctomycetota bacterium]
MDRLQRSLPTRLAAYLLFAVIVLGGHAFGQTVPRVSFDRIDLSAIKGSNQAAAIHQDQRGYMWFGTGGGLIRYDGVHTRLFLPDPKRPADTLVHKQVWEIFEDSAGMLWIGTGGGISRFDPVHETFTNYREDLLDPDGLRGSIFLAIAELADGRMLFGAAEGGMNLFDPKTGHNQSFVHHPGIDAADLTDQDFPFHRVDVIKVGPDGTPWIGGSTGVARMDPDKGTFQRMEIFPMHHVGLKDAPARELLFDETGKLWVGLHSGLATVNQENATISWHGAEKGQGPMIRGRIYGLAEDLFGRLWVARYNGDLVLLDRERAYLGRYNRRLGDETSLPSSLLDMLFVDRTGVLWISTFGGGIAKHTPHPGGMRTFVHHPEEPNSLGPGKVNELLHSTDGSLLVGGMAGLRRLSAEGVFTEVALPFGNGAYVPHEIRELTAVGDGTYWASGARSLMHFDSNDEILFQTKWRQGAYESFGGALVLDLLWDPAHGLWIGTKKGLFLRDSDTGGYRVFRSEKGNDRSLSSDEVRHLALDETGALWVGTSTGVDRFEAASGDFRRFRSQEQVGATPKGTFGLLPRDDGSLWMVDPDGALVLRPGANAFERIPNPPGPGIWKTRFLIETQDHQLMVGFLEGLKLLNPDTLQYDPRILRKESPLDNFLSEEPLMRDNGDILLPSQGGIFVVDPNDFPEETPLPAVVFTGVKLFHEPLGGGALAENLELAYDENLLSFQFAALDYSNSRPHRFEVWMEGVDKDWRDVGSHAEVSYPNLEPGAYTFHVRLFDTADLGESVVATKSFVVLQPFWMATWFRIGAAGMLFFSGWAVQRYRVARVRRRNTELENLHRRMTAESKRRETMQENLSITLDSIADGVISMDEELRVLALNPVASKLTGWPQEEAVGRPVHEVFQVMDLDTREPVTNPRRWLRSDPAHAAAPLRALLHHADGSEYMIATSVAAMRRPDGKSYGTVLVFRDITDRTALEAQLAQAQKMESLGRLAGGIAHDFNNLLTSIQGYADLVRMDVERQGNAGGRSKEYVDAVLRSSKRGADLVGQLLAFSRRSESATEELELHDVLEQSVEMLKRTLDPAIEIILDDEAERSVVNANASLLVNVFLNLGINAGDAMQGGGRLRFSTSLHPVLEGDRAFADGLAPGDYLEVAVQDTGAGMSDAMRERIFEPFYTTKDLGDGTGLGLPTALSTVRSFHGTILVDTSPGRGTTMRVVLPLVDRELPSAPTQPSSGPSEGKGTILLIEDDEAVMELCESFLTSLGYVVLIARDGLAGAEEFEKSKASIDLVILDYLMPRCNGVEVVRRIRAAGGDQPIMMITGFSLGVTREEILASGVDAVLTKPFLPLELAERIKVLLRGVEAAN